MGFILQSIKFYINETLVDSDACLFTFLENIKINKKFGNLSYLKYKG